MSRSPAPPLPPLLPGLPVVGSWPDVERDFLGCLVRAAREVGPLARIAYGPPGWRETLYVVSAPELVGQVLTDPELFTKDEPGYREIRRAVGDTMLSSEGAAWLRQRRVLAPVFTPRRIAASYVPVFAAHTADLVSRWRVAAVQGVTVDAYDDLLGLASRTIGQVLFGSDMAAAEGLRVAVDTVNAELLRRTVSAHPPPPALPTRANRRLARALAEVQAMVAGLVADRAAHPVAGAQDLLSLLLEPDVDGADGPAPRFDRSEVAAQVLGFWLAGHDTTATSLACTLMLLAQHPSWQEVVAREVEEVLRGRPVTGADLPRLEWTQRVVRESMRILSASHSIGRSPARDTVLGGYRVPAGVSLVVSPHAVHRSPAVWDVPDVFDPGRFNGAGADRSGRGRYAWIPFGAGPHTCVGMQLALAEVTVVVATVLQHLRLSTPLPVVPVEAAVTLHPVGRLDLAPQLRAGVAEHPG